MRVTHISSAPFNGGAARAAFRLHQGLFKEESVDSTWLDPGTGARGPGIVRISPAQKGHFIATRWKRRKWAKVVQKHFAPTSPPASNPIGWGSVEMFANLPIPDVWNLHWVSWFLDWEKMLPWMAERAPIVWTLHDLNPLRGIWHYTPTSAERTPVRLAFEQKATELKRKALSRVPPDRLTFIGPSRWMVEACQNSDITMDFPVKHIPYGLDTDLFQPRNPAPLREICGIPMHAPVIGFIADNLSDPRKGMEQLQQALAVLSQQGSSAHLITVGNGQIDAGGLPHLHLGPIHNDLLLSNFYSTCDVFVCPSLEDNLPNTVLESLACGTPVVAYAIGGMPDMIKPEINGLIVEEVGNPDCFFAAVESLLTKCRLEESTSKVSPLQWHPFEFTTKRQAESYIKLYSSLTIGHLRQ